MEIVPRSLPELFNQLGDQNNSQKHKKDVRHNFNRKINRNHKIVLFLVFCYFSWDFPMDPPGSLPVDSKKIISASNIRGASGKGG